jgi:uncharacterized protein YjbI with pentapeptide repeats
VILAMQVEQETANLPMKHVRSKRGVIVLSGLALLTTGAAYGDHLPPVTPVLPGQDHQHENHSGANFMGADLRDVNFSEGNFTGATFEDARLERVLFVGATLDGANLRTNLTDAANFTGASLVNAQMGGMEGTGVIFADADLSGVVTNDSFFYFSDFRNATFAGADLHEFLAYDSDFRGADLSTVIAIDTLFLRSIYDSSTRFPPGYDPQGVGMILVPEPATATLLCSSLILAGFSRRENSERRPFEKQDRCAALAVCLLSTARLWTPRWISSGGGCPLGACGDSAPGCTWGSASQNMKPNAPTPRSPLPRRHRHWLGDHRQ